VIRQLVVILILIAVTVGQAAELGSKVYIGGFVSQGYLNSEDNNYLMPRAREGSGEFNEAALIVSAQPTDRIRVGIQLLGRDFGTRQRSAVAVDWAFGEYHWRDQLGLRAGKIKLPYGFYNQSRDVDMLRTSVLLPQSVYSENDRDLLIAYEGVGLYGNIMIGSLGDLDYELSFGSLNVPESGHADTERLFMAVGRESEEGVAEYVADYYGLPADSATASLDRVDDLELAVPWILGGSVIWNTPVSGLRVGTTYMEGDAEASALYRYDVQVDQGTTVPAYVPYTQEVSVDLDLNEIFTGSLEFHRGHWTLASEFGRQRMGKITSIGWYASVDYRLNKHWAFQSYYSSFIPDDSDRHGEKYEAAGLPDYYAWQNDLALAVRADINDFWLIKFEYHHMDGAALADKIDLPEGEVAQQHWRVWTAKTTFHF